MAFLEYQFPVYLSYGGTSGPAYSTLVVSAPITKAQSRIQQQSRNYKEYKVKLTDHGHTLINTLREFMIACQGRTNGFRYKDWTDYQVTLEPLPYSGGTTLQLQREYSYYGQSEIRIITKPQENLVPVTLYLNGTLWPSAGNWSLNTTTGVITLDSAQAGGSMFTWSGQYDIPVRFDEDIMQVIHADFDVFNWETVSILEIPV